MAMSRPFQVAAGISAVALVLGVLFFFQTKDPMILIFAIWVSLLAWGISFVIHLLRVGIPIRIVRDERREP